MSFEDIFNNMAQSGDASGTGIASPAMSVAGTLLSSVGQQMGGMSHLASGQASVQAAQFQAEQLRQNAGQQVAASQQSAADIQRNTDYITSHALAVAGASGGGASDPTVINLIARTAGESAYRQSLALYQGTDKARQMNLQASATELGGQMALTSAKSVNNASNIGAMSTLMKGGASLYSRYGGGGPSLNSGAPTAAAYSANDWLTS
jgi:hypothetical protein